MANSYYARATTFARLTRAQGPEVTGEFDNVETGFDAVETAVDKKVEAPGSATGWAFPAAAANKYIRFNSAATALEAAAVSELGSGLVLDEDDFGSNSADDAPSQQSTVQYLQNEFLIDEDDFLTDSATRPSSQQATKAYVTGTQSIPITSFNPAASNGCAPMATHETTAGRPDIMYWAFDKDSDEHAQFIVPMPKGWNEGTITFRVHWTHNAGAVTTGVAWGLQAVAFADGDSFDTAYGTAVVVTDDAQGAVEEVDITAESSALTIAGSPGAQELVCFDIYRDVSDGNDDLADDAWLVAVDVFFTTERPTDD